jgi:ABC-type transporter Mla maintaining outer membrane lipid asymmetry permease subunit MlaE
MNNDSESILVFFSMILGFVLFAIALIKGPRITFMNPHGYVDWARWKSLVKFLLVITVCSIPIGFIVTRDLLIVSKYIGLNLMFGIIMGSNIFLVRDSRTKNSKR